MVKRILFIVFVALVGTGILMSLGKWQLDRLAWKQQILRNIETRITDPEIPLPTAFDPAVDKYQSVSMRGTLRGDYIRVLGSLKLVGAVNKIIAPVVIDQRVIMVDLGYLKEEDLERLALSGDVAITGNLHWPDETDSYTPPPDLGATYGLCVIRLQWPNILVRKTSSLLPKALTRCPQQLPSCPLIRRAFRMII
jgi:surfeit locus 1 family protein